MNDIPIVDEKRYITNSETFFTCNQHVQFTIINSKEFHACISYMSAHMLGNDTHVRAMKKVLNSFLHVANIYFLQLLIRENIGHACSLQQPF